MAPSSFLHPFARPAKDAAEFLTLVGGEGAQLWDAAGNRYIDAMGSLWYCNAGHGQRRIIDAIKAQLDTLATYNTFDPFTNDAAEGLAARIAAVAPLRGAAGAPTAGTPGDGEARVFFTCSGSEAVDTALKLARLSHRLAGRPERTLIVSRRHGYHGVNYGGTTVQGIEANREGWGALLPDVVHVPHDDLEAASVLFTERGEQIAAVITEPVQGAGGVNPPPPGYLAGLRRLCDDHGAYLIIDEVICAWGRLGRWFGSEYYGVRPDLITFAKGVTSGYVPLGGVVLAPSVHVPLAADPSFTLRHGYTYSGHPTSCAAGLATMALYEEDGLFERALPIGKLLSDGLASLAADGVLAGYRGEGAVWAAELLPGTDSVGVRDRMLARGVISRPLNDVMAFCPPLVISDAEVARCVDVLAEALR
jgi:adenosylmethionine-8-amino-7-oxononanoate aminotransferase